MARAPKIGESGYARIEHDVYRTPAWVTEALLEEINLPPGLGVIWEPAAGDGDMARVLMTKAYRVITSDIRKDVAVDYVFDFCGTEWSAEMISGRFPMPAAIITNPPYEHAETFITRSLSVIAESPGGILALLLPFEYDTALFTRGHLFRHPFFSMKIPLRQRIRWLGFEDKASPRQNHAWYVWDRYNILPPTIRYPR